MTVEEKAFLDVIAYAEGTLGISNNGYDVLVNDGKNHGKSRIVVGWTTNTTMKHGENKWLVTVNNSKSTAGGRYQFIGSTWKELNGGINVPISKINQDKTALKLLRQKLGSNYDFKINNVTEFGVIAGKLNKTWTSFKVKSMAELFGIYKDALLKYKH